MKKTVFKTVLAAASLVAVAGAAHATTLDINVYGASAQYGFWKGTGATFMADTVANGGLGCTSVSSFIPDAATGAANGIIVGHGCQAPELAGATDVNIRVSNKASYDGIFAVTSSTDAQRVTTCGSNLDQRPMAQEPTGTNTYASLSCVPVTIGATDVPASAFVQKSIGPKQGPLPAGTQPNITRVFNNQQGIDISALGATPIVYQPVKVPFGFFLTSNVKAKTCATGPTVGDFCNSDADCNPSQGGTCAATSAPVTNITRAMVTQLLSNSLPKSGSPATANWNSFAGFDSLPIAVCVRHSGSGSHATIDLAAMNKAWGKTWPLSTTANQFWYNDSTGDLLSCMNEAQATVKNGRQTVVAGAVGYADADTDLTKSGAIPAGVIYGPLKYNGAYPNAQNIISGVYDLFADQTLYVNPNASTDQKNTVGLLMNYLNDSTGSHLNGTNYRNFWAAAKEMKVGRGGNPFNYPYRGGQ